MIRYFTFLCLTSVVFFDGDAVFSNDDVQKAAAILRDTIDRSLSQLDSNGPMCGVYSASRSITILGLDCKPSDYFSAKYVGDSKGSNPDEILAILRKYPVTAIPFSNLGRVDLIAVGTPVIVSVRKEEKGKAFDHWICVLARDSNLIGFDGSGNGVLMSWSDFLRTWNGFGIVVAKDGEMPQVLLWLNRFAILCLTGMVSAVVWQTLRNSHLVIRHAGTVIGLIAISSIFSVGVSPDFWWGELIRPKSDPSLQQANLNRLLEVSTTKSRLLIDARSRKSFSYGTIPGALNIPVSVSRLNLLLIMENVPRDIPLTVFCQSSQCPYADMVANKLFTIGYNDVETSTFGWLEFSQHVAQKEPALE